MYVDSYADMVIYYNPAMTKGACYMSDCGNCTLVPQTTYREYGRDVIVDSLSLRDVIKFGKPTG